MEFKQYIQQTEEWIEVANEAYKAREARLLYEKAEARAFDRLKQLSKNNPSKGGTFIFDYTQRTGNINYSAIPELKNIDLEKYRNPSLNIWKLEKVIIIQEPN